MAVNNCAGAVLLAAAALAGARPRSSSRAGSWWRSAAASASRRWSRRRARGWSRWGPPTARAGPTTSGRSLSGTGAILRAHPSNFRQLGFVREVEIEELCELGVPVIDDVGSGVLADELAVLADEPAVRRSVAAGAALVCFSGDKLLGGPQAG